jgi:UDP-N-acetylglucosamine 1-carboxyvinyltransferase
MFFDEPSVTGTEHILMAAVVSQGHTLMRNAACEPHVQDLAHMLNAMGARSAASAPTCSTSRA